MALKQKLESEKNALVDDGGISTRKLRNRDDKRKEALASLKQVKQWGDKSHSGKQSILQKRFQDNDEDDHDGFQDDGDNDDDSDYEKGRGRKLEILEKRRRRKEWEQQHQSPPPERVSAREKKKMRKVHEEVELVEQDLSGPIDVKYANAVRDHGLDANTIYYIYLSSRRETLIMSIYIYIGLSVCYVSLYVYLVT
jgi:hypothetical protein